MPLRSTKSKRKRYSPSELPRLQHLATSIPNFIILEQGATNTAAYKDIFPGGWKESLSEMWVPEGPGIGVDFSPAYVKENAITLGQ